MTYQEALKKIRTGTILGLLFQIIGILFTIISLLKYIYFGFRQADSLNIFARFIQPLVFEAYDKTRFLALIWEQASIPDFNKINNFSNIPFFFFYILIFVGSAMLGAANKLSRTVRKVQSQIEEQQIRESIQGKPIRSFTEIRKTITINESGGDKFINRFGELIVAPIITTLIGALFTKLLGLT